MKPYFLHFFMFSVILRFKKIHLYFLMRSVCAFLSLKKFYAHLHKKKINIVYLIHQYFIFQFLLRQKGNFAFHTYQKLELDI